VKSVLPSIVKINIKGCGFTGSGSGFSVGEWIVTNRHVVKDAKAISFLDSRGRKHTVVDWFYSESDDLALIAVERGLVPALRLADKDAIPGDLVATGGYPLGGPQVSSRGRVVSKSTDLAGDYSSSSFVWKTTAEILPGDSGGPMIDTRGSVVGVMFALDLVDGFELAIPLSRLKAVLTEKTELKRGGGCH
jgi:S1-C subfamily serine protease